MILRLFKSFMGPALGAGTAGGEGVMASGDTETECILGVHRMMFATFILFFSSSI